MLVDLQKRIEENGFTVEVTDETRALILKKGYDPVFGARPLKRAIQNLVEDRVSEEILQRTVQPGDKIVIDAHDDEIVISKS